MLKLSDLSNVEKIKVLNSNKELENEVCELYEENIMLYVSDVLDYFNNSLNDWSIGFNNYNYIEVSDSYGFIEGVKIACDCYGFLEDTKELDNTLELMNKLYCMDCDNKQYDNLSEKIDNEINDIKGKVVNKFNILTDYSYKDIEECFLEFYFDEYVLTNEDFSIDDNYILYEDIAYTKCYN